jgi:hypothetical protein
MTRDSGPQIAFRVVIVTAMLAASWGCSGTPEPEGRESGGSAGSPVFLPDNKPAPPIRWVERTIAAGTLLRVVSDQPVTADGARDGDPVEARVEDAIVTDGLVGIPSGSKIQGTVLSSRRGGAGRITLVVGWTRIETPTGANAGLTARTTMIGHPGSILLEANVPFEIALDTPLVIGVRQ